MFIQVMLLLIGFIVLVESAKLFIDSASSLAKNLKVSKTLIGLTVVAFGTSVPEFAISCSAILGGNGEIVLGNVIGSNIMNILLILGIGACIKPIVVGEHTLKKEIPLMLVLTLATIILFKDTLFNGGYIDSITRSEGLILVILFGFFIYYLIERGKDRKNELVDNSPIKYGLAMSLIYLGISIFGIVVGAKFIVDAAEQIALLLKVSERLISLTVVALGTSLPELVTVIVASRKKEQELLMGNIIGSNIFNIGIVLGLATGLLGGIEPSGFTYIDLLVFMGSGILLYLFTKKNRDISRKEGIMFLILFLIYYGLSVML